MYTSPIPFITVDRKREPSAIKTAFSAYVADNFKIEGALVRGMVAHQESSLLKDGRRQTAKAHRDCAFEAVELCSRWLHCDRINATPENIACLLKARLFFGILEKKTTAHAGGKEIK